MIALHYRAIKMITRTNEECFLKQKKNKTQKGSWVFKRKIDGNEKLGMHTEWKKKHKLC